jgi:DNA-binding NtrC family response regulator
VIERSVIVTKGSRIRRADLPPFVLSPGARPSSSSPGGIELPVGTTVEQAEKNLILKTLEATGQNKTRAAEILGISLKTLHNKLKKYRKTT